MARLTNWASHCHSALPPIKMIAFGAAFIVLSPLPELLRRLQVFKAFFPVTDYYQCGKKKVNIDLVGEKKKKATEQETNSLQ